MTFIYYLQYNYYICYKKKINMAIDLLITDNADTFRKLF